MAARRLALLGLLALAGLGALAPARAPAQQLQQFDASQEAILTADEISYDNELGVAVARGNVEVVQGERTLLADTVTYNQRTNAVVASGNVSLIEPSGEVMFADYMELSDGMKEGVIRDIRILLTDNSRLAANGARRTGGNRTEMSKGVFSACKPCEEDPARAPIWQLKARRVVHDEKEQVIRYNDARMEMFGLPIAYTPYFQHPDPTVKRQSGFLMPSHVISSDLGFMSGVPYFWAIDKDKDVTLLPMYSTKKGPLGRMDYRQAFPTGVLRVDGAIARTDRGIDQLFTTTDPSTTIKDEVRGHVFGRGRWDVDDTWRTGFDVQRVSDRTYLSLYKITNNDLYNPNNQTLVTNAYVEGFMGRSYAAANGYAFQGLRSFDTGRTTPFVPVFWDYNYVSEATAHGGRFNLDANTMVLGRTDGADSRRLSVAGGYQVPYVSPIGEVYRFSASVQGDVYSSHDVQDPGRPQEIHDGVTGRLFPQLGVQWSLPFVRQGEEYRQLIEPVLGGFASPNGRNPAAISNEDSIDIEFDDTRLWSPNRFTGIDRVDSGVRGIYGMKTGLYHVSGSYATAFFGQSYNVRQNEQFTEGSGLAGHRSDYVARVEMSPHPWFDVITRFRLNKDDFGIERNETVAVVGPPILQLQGSYIRAPSSQFSNGRVQQAQAYLSSKVDENWTVHIMGLRDLNEGNDLGWINYGAGALYQDDCFTFDVRWIRTFTANQEVSAGDTIYFKLSFRLLGDLAGGFDAPRINGGNVFGQN